jgi:hypothetical protein
MWRDLRTTIAIILAVLLDAPLISADSQQPTASYLALVFHQNVPTNVPLPSVPLARTLCHVRRL